MVACGHRQQSTDTGMLIQRDDSAQSRTSKHAAGGDCWWLRLVVARGARRASGVVPTPEEPSDGAPPAAGTAPAAVPYDGPPVPTPVPTEAPVDGEEVVEAVWAPGVSAALACCVLRGGAAARRRGGPAARRGRSQHRLAARHAKRTLRA